MATSKLLRFARYFSLSHVTATYICAPALGYGPSMLPTMNIAGDVLLVEGVSHRLGMVVPGDIVSVRSPANPTEVLAKRVVGLEGQTVSFLEDSWFGQRSRSLVVPKGHVWIQGDNISMSLDSRQLGPIPYGLILGKVLCRVWPPQDFGRLRQREL